MELFSDVEIGLFFFRSMPTQHIKYFSNRILRCFIQAYLLEKHLFSPSQLLTKIIPLFSMAKSESIAAVKKN